MAYNQNTVSFEKMLPRFMSEPDPMLSMLEWLCHKLIQEAFVNGVSTRKIECLAKSLGIESISASQVSEINKELNEQVAEFRQRRLESTYPVI
jgi:hypothetical protein